jgi:hypothetical protein
MILSRSARSMLSRMFVSFSLVLSASFSVSAASLIVSTNLNITKSSANNAETTIAVNPLNPNNLFADDTYSVIGRYTTNGGATWQNSNLSALPSSIGDVATAWDNYGNLFLVQFGGSNLKIAVGLSTNGGASFSLLYQTTSTKNDQPTVTVGPGTNGQGSVWICYTTSGNNLVAQGAAVTGLGLVGNFSPAQTAAANADFGDIAIGPSGQVMVVYQNNTTTEGPDNLTINVDTNGLAAGGFGPASIATVTQVGAFATIPAQPKRLIDAEAGLAWDRSGGPHNGRVYLMYTDRPDTSSADTDIYVRYSDNGGASWTSPVRVNDDTFGNGKSQFLPRIALDQTTGNIAVSFYDCRNSSGNNTVEVWASVSTDGGVTFSPNAKVSGGVSSALVSAISATGFDYGDYTGLAFNAGAFYPVWADNSNSTGDNPAGANGNFDMYTARVIVVDAPAVTSIQPTNATVKQGQSTNFTVSATGSSLTYRWRLNGVPISGATNSTYTIATAQCANAGTYDAVVTNVAGSVTSSIALLTVISPPGIATQPTNITAQVGQTVAFTVTATNGCGDGRTYQWRHSTTNLPGATGSSFVITNVQPFAAGSYSVLVTNLAGSVTSSVATLTVLLPQIVSPILAGTNFSFSFQTVSGKTYVVQYENVLSNGGWSNLQSVPGDGSLKTFLTPISAAPQRFFRILVQ